MKCVGIYTFTPEIEVLTVHQGRMNQMQNKLKTMDAEILQATPMSKTMFIVQDLISQGANVLSGTSKIGNLLADALAEPAGCPG